MNEVAGSKLENTGAVQALPVGSEVDLFEGSALAEPGLAGAKQLQKKIVC